MKKQMGSKKKMKKVSTPTNKYVAQIKEAIDAVANEAGIDPSDVSKRDLDGLISDWVFKKAGGLELVKKAYYPVEGKDLAGIHDAKLKAKKLVSKEQSLAEELSLAEHITNALENMPEIKIKPYSQKSKKKISRHVNIVLSDLHIGSDISKEETGGLNFGIIEESRRLARITKEVIDYKPQHRKETELNVFLLGDILQNALHDPRDGAPLAEQFARCVHLLSQSLSQLVANYPKVTVYCATGNHGRNIGRHHTRAVNQKWDSIETMVYVALQKIMKPLGVNFIIPKTPFTVCEIFGQKIFLTHGDTVLKPGYPGKSIQTRSLEEQVNRFNANLKDHEEYQVLIVGHVHTGSVTHLSNGAVMITNGAMVPSDEFATSIGLMENNCGQMLFETVPGYPVGDVRFIRVSEKDDRNLELDKIIKPYSGLND
jgi:UDP-2,3-diacylglucosamine pyrophosphatase LpxH